MSIAPGVSDTQCAAKALRVELWKSIIAHCREDLRDSERLRDWRTNNRTIANK